MRCQLCVFFLMIRRPPRSTLDRSSAASDVYKRQVKDLAKGVKLTDHDRNEILISTEKAISIALQSEPVSYTHLRAHETVLDLVCRLLLEKKTH